MVRSTIDKLPSGNYRVRYEAPTGKWVSRTFGTKEPARRWLRDELRRIDRGEWTDLALRKVPFGDWAHRWKATLTDIKPKTRAGYLSLLRVHILPEFAKEPLNSITPIRIQEWISDLQEAGLSASRIRQARQVLGAIMETAIREDLVARNPTRGTRLPRTPRKDMIIITPFELEELVAHLDDPYGLITLTLGYTGMRWGELAAVRRKRIDVGRQTLHVAESLAEVGSNLHFGTTKTHRDRTLSRRS